jgi:hypothetical protein
VKLNPKTLGVLLEVAVYGAPRGVAGLMVEFEVGREQLTAALTQLASIGFIQPSNGVTAKGTFWHKVDITPEGLKYAHDWMTGKKPLLVLPNGETRISIPLNSDIADTYKADIPYSSEQYDLYPYSVNQGAKTSFRTSEKTKHEGETMSLGSTPIDPDDLAAELEKDKARKKQERQEQAKAHYQNRQRIRATRKVVDWSPADVINYFAEQVKQIWNVEQVAISQRPKLIKAMDLFRIDNSTNGEIDKYLMDTYLASRKWDKSILYNPEEVFWSFINWAPSKVAEAIRTVRPEEDADTIAAIRAKNKKMLGLR